MIYTGWRPEFRSMSWELIYDLYVRRARRRELNRFLNAYTKESA